MNVFKKVLLTTMAYFGISACPETKKLAKELTSEINGRFEVIEKPGKRKKVWKHGGRP